MSPEAAPQFGEGYASVYDSLYADKDYAAECDLVEAAFERFGFAPVHSLLDLGCGTGGHAIPLTQRGYEVAGADLSGAMLAQARRKAADAGVELALHEGDLKTVRAGGPFDSVLMMFAVIGYQRTNDEVLAALTNVRRHLADGGLFIFDSWYGPGVLTDPPGSRERVVHTAEGDVRRSVTSELDVRHHLCSVHYDLAGATHARETHVMRFFFPLELELFLREASMELVSLSPVGTLDGEPGVEHWNVVGVARAL